MHGGGGGGGGAVAVSCAAAEVGGQVSAAGGTGLKHGAAGTYVQQTGSRISVSDKTAPPPQKKKPSKATKKAL